MFVFLWLSCSSSGNAVVEKSQPIEEDTAVVDTAVDDTAFVEPSQPSSEPDNPELSIDVSFTSPVTESQFEEGDSVSFVAQAILSSTQEGVFDIVWESSTDGVLYTEQVEDPSSLSWSTNSLSPGLHTIYLRVTAPDGQTGVGGVKVGVCGWELVDDFSNPIDENVWLLHRDAYRDSRGWLEMTGNAQGKKGAIFNIGNELQPGNLTMRFDISTGQCDEPDTACTPYTCDADGFAVSIYKTNTAEDLVTLLENTSTGGGLGYAYNGDVCASNTDCISGTKCVAGTCTPESFHIEFDTWYNETSDPTELDHVGIMLNGDQSTHHLYSEIADLEDNLWHEVIVKIRGQDVETWLDGSQIITGNIPGLTFKGGFIGFTGTTGSCINYHRFDNLYVQPVCTY
ncbi:MAG: hypothetical protein CL916_13690 [Deltaproteobacteria bacterium]|nr:hypothetical protein [Deltaproteobacteria bacterium]